MLLADLTILRHLLKEFYFLVFWGSVQKLAQFFETFLKKSNKNIKNFLHKNPLQKIPQNTPKKKIKSHINQTGKIPADFNFNSIQTVSIST
jgi:hypothetical protein